MRIEAQRDERGICRLAVMNPCDAERAAAGGSGLGLAQRARRASTPVRHAAAQLEARDEPAGFPGRHRPAGAAGGELESRARCAP